VIVEGDRKTGRDYSRRGMSVSIARRVAHASVGSEFKTTDCVMNREAPRLPHQSRRASVPCRERSGFSVTGNVTPEHVCGCCSDFRTGWIRTKGKPALSQPGGLLATGRHQPSNASPDRYGSFSYLNLIKCRLGNLALIWFRPCATHPTT
jgi:hypothetical protein